jgi:GrpB-like predicted nucleotidyltransferase (UPF0157 family)
MIDEPVHILPHRTEWAESFLGERKRLAENLGVLQSSVEHIGSTAVAGLSAKPIIDIMIGADPFPPSSSWSDVLAHLGYSRWAPPGCRGAFTFVNAPLCSATSTSLN